VRIVGIKFQKLYKNKIAKSDFFGNPSSIEWEWNFAQQLGLERLLVLSEEK